MKTSQTIFNIYDIDHKGYIAKEEFIKMLYNYPKSDIRKFYDEVVDAETNAPVQSLDSSNPRARRQSVYNPNLLESVANLGAVFGGIDNMRVKSNTSRNMGQGDGQQDSSVLSSYPDEQSSIRSRKNSEYNMSIDGNADLSRNMPSARRRPRGSLAIKMRQNKIFPTSFGNQIVIWADAIYNRYGSDGKLTFDGFSQWAQRHQDFILSFRKYFRYQLWRVITNPKTNQKFLGYAVQPPILQDRVEIQTGLNNSHPINGYAILYADFLLIWPNDDFYQLPRRVIILKNIKIMFNGDNFSIEFAHECKRYKSLRLGLNRPPVWKFWKDTLEKYSRCVQK